MTLIVGIPACTKEIGGEPQFATPARYVRALLGAADAVPVLLPPTGEAMLSVLDRLDGLVLSGSPSNVHPSRYGSEASLTPDSHDLARDGTTLPLVRAAIDRGMPVLAICRGIQELNVAFGGTLHQLVHTVSGRMDHRDEDDPDNEVNFRMRHPVAVTGRLARIVGAATIMVNSLHHQAIDRLGEGLVAEATAPDGTIEAVRVTTASGFAMGVQFHPEWHFATDAASRAIFAAFGAACRDYAAGLRQAA